MRALLLIDHGSRVTTANEALTELEALVRERLPEDMLVTHAHMELASPTIDEAVAHLTKAGATHITAIPCMLTPGRHASEDIPRLVGEACDRAGINHRTSPPLGVHALLADLVLVRAGLA